VEKLAQLKPIFRRPHGTITAASSSYFADGASACLLAEAEKGKQLGLKPKAFIREYLFVAQDPTDQLLLGPANAIPRVLARQGLKLDDVDVFEVHEAFAGQVLACLAAMDSEWASKNVLGLNGRVGALPMEKLNNWGGSLSIGHPFGATGTRLLMHAANRFS